MNAQTPNIQTPTAGASHCRRCHRAIINKRSVINGYGPVCWNKINATADNEIQANMKTTIIDQRLATESITKIRERIRRALQQEGARLCTCGKPLHAEDLEHHDHEGGDELPGFGAPQWLYIHCDCGHDMSVWKLKIPDEETPTI